MLKADVRVYDVLDKNVLPHFTTGSIPQEGDPVEINHEMYYVCEKNCDPDGNLVSLGLIPLVVRNPREVKNIKEYINCLAIAHKRVQFRKNNKTCDFDECDEMIIT